MHPILLKIGPITIYSYGFCIAVAFLVATYLSAEFALRSKHLLTYGLNKTRIYDLSVYLSLGGIIGARLGYVITNFDYYQDNLLESFLLWRGGLVFYWGLVGALLTCVWWTKKLAHLPFLVVADCIIPYVALGQSIGRIGCFLNGCCYGKMGHPVQLYESFAALIIFAILKAVQDTKPKERGYILFLYLSLYGAARFTLEFMRADNPPVVFGLTISQVISIFLFMAGAAYVSIRIYRNRPR